MVSFSPFFLQTDRWKWKIARRGFFILSGFAIAFFLNRALERHDFYASFLVDLLPAFNHQFSEPLGLFLSLSTVHQVPYPPATIPNEQDIFLVICHRGPRLPLFTNGGNGLNINNRPYKELYSKDKVGAKTNSVAALWWNQQKLFLFVVDSRHFGGLLNPLKLHSRYKYWTGKILQFKSLLCNTEWDLSFGLLEVSFAIFLSTQFFVAAYIFKGTFSFQRILYSR